MNEAPRDKIVKSTGELIDFIKEHIYIRINENQEMSGIDDSRVNRVTVGLYIGSEEIDSDYIDIPVIE
jgi:hypothetical protein